MGKLHRSPKKRATIAQVSEGNGKFILLEETPGRDKFVVLDKIVRFGEFVVLVEIVESGELVGLVGIVGPGKFVVLVGIEGPGDMLVEIVGPGELDGGLTTVCFPTLKVPWVGVELREIDVVPSSPSGDPDQHRSTSNQSSSNVKTYSSRRSHSMLD